MVLPKKHTIEDKIDKLKKMEIVCNWFDIEMDDDTVFSEL